MVIAVASPPPGPPRPPPRRPAGAASLFAGSKTHAPEKSVFACARSLAGNATSDASAMHKISDRFMRSLLQSGAASPSNDGERFFFDMRDLQGVVAHGCDAKAKQPAVRDTRHPLAVLPRVELAEVTSALEQRRRCIRCTHLHQSL